jgi:alpha-beta hydrolase superfamily lysophospholipase
MRTEIDGGQGLLKLHRWANQDATHVAVIVHGLGEHAGRYNHVAQALVDAGATVYAGDHYGHGASEGEKGVVEDIELFVDDTKLVVDLAKNENPGLPIAMVGHSMGGLIATRYAQRPDHGLTALVLSAPAVGLNPELIGLLELEEFPDVPIDPSVLSRDPAVGEAYAADPLVYHGPLQKGTMVALVGSVGAVGEGPAFGGLPTLWLHGTEDFLVPIESARPVVEGVAGGSLEHKRYEGARHEVFNETNQDEVIADAVAFLARTLDRASDPA